jgi:hypothetical protein
VRDGISGGVGQEAAGQNLLIQARPLRRVGAERLPISSICPAEYPASRSASAAAAASGSAWRNRIA